MIGQTRCKRRAGAFAVLALIAALAVALTPPAEARRVHHRHAGPTTPTDPSKDAALIIDGATGRVLYARNQTLERHPASLTKMMTLYLLFEALKRGDLTLNSNITVSAHAASQRPTNLHLRSGDEITVDLAIKAIVVRSANDVAAALAEALGGTEGHFAEMMTAKAHALGMHHTFYHNASGLPDDLQVTTAADLAVLARHLAYDFPQYYPYFSVPSFSFRGTEYPTHDNLIGRYRGADGIKTGYTGASGFNLVSSVVRDGHHIIGVVMGGRTAIRRDREMIRLLDLTFDAAARNPRLVAHAEVPWRVAVNTVPGAALSPSGINGLLANGPASEADDEDTAERRADDEDDAPGEAAPPADNHPPPVADNHPPQVAAAPPRQVAAARAPSMRPMILGEGDAGDGAVPRLNARDWTIQIGAFADLAQARAQLAAYAERAMDMLGQAQRIVVPFQSADGHTLYRARFGPFAEREARQICARLTERGQTCFAAIADR